MTKTETIKHITGYITGFLVFILFLPALICGFSQIPHPLCQIPIFPINLIGRTIAVPLFMIGVVFAVWSNIDLLRKGKGGPTDVFNWKISPRSKKLVATGPYRCTRNPMVFGINAIYFSIAFYFNSMLSLIFVVLWSAGIIIYLKLSEEKRLARDFGDEYITYKNNVPMILPKITRDRAN